MDLNTLKRLFIKIINIIKSRIESWGPPEVMLAKKKKVKHNFTLNKQYKKKLLSNQEEENEYQYYKV